jgi:3-carboxy-cis,cis-muconate cycloisomerase
MSFSLLAAIGGDEPMAAIFGEDRTIQAWLEVEAAVAYGLAHAGLMDDACASRIADGCSMSAVDRQQLWQQTANVGYPILPLVRMICDAIDPADARFVHFGATTQDIMDSALAIQLREATDRLLEQLSIVGDGLARLTSDHATTLMAGRTHAQFAVPTTFGAKCAVFLAEFSRHRDRLSSASEECALLSMFGAGGTSAALMAGIGDKLPLFRDEVARRLDLRVTSVPWHVARDRFAVLTQTAALTAASCVRLAREVVDLSRSEVGEIAEIDGLYRGASSTMPQKSNPISAELAIGFGVMAESSAGAMFRAIEAGHERAAGEWQVEWQAVPDVFQATAGALAAAGSIISGLRVFPERMRSNLDVDGGRIMSEAYMIALAGQVGRDKAHELVYEAVRQSRDRDEPLLEVLSRSVGEPVWTQLGPSLPKPEDYIGEAAGVCDAAVRHWRAGGARSVTDTGKEGLL